MPGDIGFTAQFGLLSGLREQEIFTSNKKSDYSDFNNKIVYIAIINFKLKEFTDHIIKEE